MRIAVINSTVFPIPVVGYAGLEHLCWQISKGLASKGHEVTVISPDGSKCDGCSIVETGPPGRHSEQQAYGGYPEIKDGDRVVRQAHPGYWQQLLDKDVIIDHSWNAWSYQLKAEGRLKAPILKVMHAPVNTMYSQMPPQFPGMPAVEKPCVVCISQDQANHFQALWPTLGVRVAYNGVDGEFYKPLGIKRSSRFLFLARFSSIKGPDLAIEACRKAGVGLDLIGDTSITNEPEYLEQCKRMCDGEQIRMVGPCSRGECVWWFSQAHALLHPNLRFREPFGLAPVEAMLCGCPVIAWDHGAMRETVKHGEVGWLVKSLDDMVLLIKEFGGDGFHSQLMNGWRGGCREWALDRFSVERMVDRYEELCNEAISTGGW